MVNIESFREPYSDWGYALHEAVRGECGHDQSLVEELGIVEVIAADDGENDGANWIAILKVAGGPDSLPYAFLSAGCDYTGWDCQASGSLSYAATLEELCRMHLGEDDRQRLGFDVFGNRVEAEPC